MSIEKNLPFFVYGTLRNGEGNYSWALSGRTTREVQGVLRGVHMHGVSGFPYLVANKHGVGQAVGELMYVSDDNFVEVLRSLDNLEGYRGPGRGNHYDRITRNVRTANGRKVRAYVYVASEAHVEDIRESIPVIESGDWIKHLEQKESQRRASAA